MNELVTIPIGMAVFIIVAAALLFRTAWPLAIASVLAAGAFAVGFVVWLADAAARGDAR